MVQSLLKNRYPVPTLKVAFFDAPEKFMSLGIDYYGVNHTVVRHLQLLHQAGTQVKLFGDMKTLGLVLRNLW